MVFRMKMAFQDGDRRWDCAVVRHCCFELAGHVEVDRARQAVRDQRRFEGDDGVALGEGVADGGREMKGNRHGEGRSPG